MDLNPFNSADAHGDKDHDGPDNLWEYENGTIIKIITQIKRYWQKYLNQKCEKERHIRDNPEQDLNTGR